MKQRWGGVVLVAGFLALLGVAVDARVRLSRATASPAADEATTADSDSKNGHASPVPSNRVVTADMAQRNAELIQLVRSLTSQRDQLQTELDAARRIVADRDRDLAQARKAPRPSFGPDGETNGARRVSFAQRLEQLRTEDPARYEEMQKQREEFRQRMESQAADRAAFLQQVDTASMDEQQRANHEQLMQLTTQMQALMSQLPNLSPEQAAVVRQTLAQNRQTLSDLYQAERTCLLNQTGLSLGYTPEQAAQFSAYIQQVIDQTTLPRGLGGRGGPPREQTTGTTAAGATTTATGAAAAGTKTP